MDVGGIVTAVSERPFVASPPPGSRQWRWWWLVLAVGVVGVVLLVRSLQGAPPGGIAAAHGPTQIVDGVPTGYTHDAGGAATAAANFVQAFAEAGWGRVEVDAIREHLVADDPGSELSAALTREQGRAQDEGSVLNVMPALTAVTAFDGDRAEVAIWGFGLSWYQMTDRDPISVMQLEGTSTVALEWVGDTWRVVEVSYEPGPTVEEMSLVEADSPFAKAKPTQGYYTIFVN